MFLHPLMLFSFVVYSLARMSACRLVILFYSEMTIMASAHRRMPARLIIFTLGRRCLMIFRRIFFTTQLKSIVKLKCITARWKMASLATSGIIGLHPRATDYVILKFDEALIVFKISDFRSCGCVGRHGLPVRSFAAWRGQLRK